ncbi:cupin [Pseudomonas fluorescens]|uniref:Cupin n=1 Tax=Pseudomonas fluorescens TaxID=294 RepID=A0A1T2ZA67_PSEFL|nr:cupin [Pseudomonas fluorescens]OPB00864.1 cupin [Pseudomonas fluorescens]
MTVSKTDSPTPTSLMFEPNHPVPNNSDLPVLVYTQVLSPQLVDLATRFEEMFTTQGWPPKWRSRVYDYHHYHTEGHEVLGIATGHAQLMLGGLNGHVLEVRAGDVLLLPVGTGHRNISASENFLVVGAYPPGQHADICREAPSQAQLARIKQLPFPDQSPVKGDDETYRGLWIGRRTG